MEGDGLARPRESAELGVRTSRGGVELGDGEQELVDVAVSGGSWNLERDATTSLLSLQRRDIFLPALSLASIM